MQVHGVGAVAGGAHRCLGQPLCLGARVGDVVGDLLGILGHLFGMGSLPCSGEGPGHLAQCALPGVVRTAPPHDPVRPASASEVQRTSS